MNLVIDQGNTLTKLAIFDKGNLIEQTSSPKLNKKTIIKFIGHHEVDKAILSSVRSNVDGDFRLLSTLIRRSILLDEWTKLPFQSHYQTPNTLGKDRIAAVAGAIGRYPNTNLLVIDAGTAITYELITSNHVYLGGNISPGLLMRFKALNHFTQKLPMIEANPKAPDYGVSTQSAIEAGVQKGLQYEIEGYMGHFDSQFEGIKTLITGGDAEFFAGTVKNPIFVHSNLVVEGLNRILNYNV